MYLQAAISLTYPRLRLSTKILTIDTPTKFRYLYYLIKGTIYYIIPNSTLKYTECTRLDYLYINLSQASLDCTRDKYGKNVNKDKKLLAKVIAQLLQNKKILK